MKALSEDEMYDALVRNDAEYDGIFFYAVKSTGIFCRPSCPSKKPNRDNVEFFATAKEALDAGYRPCKRCRSDLLMYYPMKEIAQEIKEHIESLFAEQAKWRDHVEELGLSDRRMTDIFRDAYGITPKAYMDQLRLKEAERLLADTDEKVIDIAAAVGFGSVSAFNRFFKSQTGGTPTMYRNRKKSKLEAQT